MLEHADPIIFIPLAAILWLTAALIIRKERRANR